MTTDFGGFVQLRLKSVRGICPTSTEIGGSLVEIFFDNGRSILSSDSIGKLRFPIDHSKNKLHY